MVKSDFKIIKSDKLSYPWEERFVIVDAHTGALLNDAQGYGYKSKDAATASALRKKDKPRPIPEKKAPRKSITEWVKQHPAVKSEFSSMKKYLKEHGGRLNKRDVQELLCLAGEANAPFSVPEFIQYFNEQVSAREPVRTERRENKQKVS